jgi:hypothetical protein
MVLISIIAIGLMGLTAIELRTSARAVAMQEARANARMALVMAVGSLQKHAGPDQRITGPADLLAGPAGSNNPIADPHWTSVWKSVMPDGGPVIERQGDRGGLRDRRAGEGWDAESELLAQLVSGNENRLRFPAGSSPADGAEFELLVGKGSLGAGGDQAGFVRAPKVRIGDGRRIPGEYAWWVGDLGTKANLATLDRFAGKNDRAAETRRLQIAQDFSALASAGEETGNGDRAKFVTPGEFDLHAGDDSNGTRFHAITTDSESVLADVRDGGLKKDLTSYLLGDGSIGGLDGTDGPASLGISDDDNLIGPPNRQAAALYPDGGEAARMADVSPSFGLLRDWARRSLSTPFAATLANPDHPATRPMDDNKMNGYGGHNQLPVQFENRVKSDVSPVLVESSIYYNLSYYETADPDPRHKIGLRLHLYPRVAIWNPYNISLKLGASMVAMQINGSKTVEVTLKDNRKQTFRMSWGRLANANGSYSGPRRGTHYFQLAPVTLAPGATVIFSPEENRVYDNTTLSNNLLSPEAAPDPARSFYMDKRPDNDPSPGGGDKDVLFKVSQTFPPNPGIKNDRLLAEPLEWREVVAIKPSGNIQAAGYTQADDYFMYWKPIPPGANANDLAAFNRLPHGRFVSCAFQYGDEDELPVQWSSRDPVPFQRTDSSAVTRQIPDRRTRDGFRLRWFREHPSNLLGSGSLADTSHLEDAPIANWNLRASYSLRSPYENVTDVAPHYFGIYTRDLFDDAVAWSSLTPRSGPGGQLGDPFDQPVAGVRRILFDVPRGGAEVVSLGAFQHLKFSEFIWNPSYAFGNSLADPRVPLSMTQPDRGLDINSREGGWNRDSIGYATDGRSKNDNGGASDADNWAYSARGLLEQFMKDQNLTFDLSYELNHSLWDRYFLSTGTSQEKRAFLEDPQENPLPNGRLRPLSESPTVKDEVLDFHRAAAALTLDGGFNVNSTRVEAWEALLLSSVGVRHGADQASFPRILNLAGTTDGTDAARGEAWTGQRLLARDEVRKLAEAIVGEVRLRGPFLSLADFVNRRLRDDETGRMGALEAALTKSGINASFTENYPLNNREELPDYRHIDNIKDPTRLEQTSKPGSAAWGALAFVTQADLLQSLGPVLAARSDTFLVRSYGSSLDQDGKILAAAWCEAVVQRTPRPLAPDESGINPDTSLPVDFGRRFEVKRFRWLHRDEV